MIIPKKLKIGGHVYKIVLKDASEYEYCGKKDSIKGELIINSKMIQSEIEATLFHEILHTINGELNEITIDSLAQQLYQVLKENNLLK